MPWLNTRSSAAIILDMKDKQVSVLLEEDFQLNVVA